MYVAVAGPGKINDVCAFSCCIGLNDWFETLPNWCFVSADNAFGTKNFCALRRKKTPFKWLGSSKFGRSLLLRGLCSVLDSGLWQQVKMSTTLKSPNRLRNFKCKKGQLSNRPPILYVPETDLVTTKEEPQVLKVKLPDDTCLNMPIYSGGNKC